MELKERTEHVSNVQHQFMPQDYAKALELLTGIPEIVEKNPISESNLPYFVKSAHPKALSLFDYGDPERVDSISIFSSS